jgi:hypothetical protein
MLHVVPMLSNAPLTELAPHHIQRPYTHVLPDVQASATAALDRLLGISPEGHLDALGSKLGSTRLKTQKRHQLVDG